MLFNKIDVYHHIESEQKKLRAMFEQLSDEQSCDNSVKDDLRAKFKMDVPYLLQDKMYYEDRQRQLTNDELRGRSTIGSPGQALRDATEYVIHVPFQGDPSLFEVSPSASNGTAVVGEVVGSEILLTFLVTDPNFNLQAEIERKLSGIGWRLENLRGSNEYMDQQINNTLTQCAAARQRAVEQRSKLSGITLNLPRKEPAIAPAKAPVKSPPPTNSTSPLQQKVGLSKERDVFISHASEDKVYVTELADALRNAGVKVWLDSLELKWGSSLRQSIDQGLKNSRYVVVVLSKAFLAKKKWTEYELSAAFALEDVENHRLLPIWHGIGFDDLKDYSAALTDRLARESNKHTIPQIVADFQNLLGGDNLQQETVKDEVKSRIVSGSAQNTMPSLAATTSMNNTQPIEPNKIEEVEAQIRWVTSADWEDLGKRINESCRFLRADSQQERNQTTETWRLAGGAGGMCEVLLKRAGTMLLRSPRIVAKLPTQILQEQDPLARWLAFLKLKGHHRVDRQYNYVDDEGKETFGGILGSIPQLALSSSVVCEECSLNEM